jgi:hypothetical protein
MGQRQRIEQQRDNVLMLRAARRENAPVTPVVDRGDSAGLTATLHDFRRSKRNLLIEYQAAVTCALGRALLNNPYSPRSGDRRTCQVGWLQEPENRLRPGALTDAKCRRSDSPER